MAALQSDTRQDQELREKLKGGAVFILSELPSNKVTQLILN